MKLRKLKLKNFRCYRDEVEISIDTLLAIIGKNDVGKSSLLEALDAFFNDKIDASDLSRDAESRTVEITCSFTDIPPQIILDSAVATTAEEECILNADGLLEIKRAITFGVKKSSAVYLIANYPVDERLSDILSKKNATLKVYAEELNVDLGGINKTKNPPIRKRIRDSIGGEKALKDIKVDGTLDAEDNLRALWSSLQKYLPVFTLFKVDKTLDDKDGDIQDPMKLAVAEALATPEILELLSQVEAKVKEVSTEVADKTIEKLKTFDEGLSERLKSAFTKDPKYAGLFDLTLMNENNIPLNKRGSGIRRLVLLSFFLAQAERRQRKENAPAIIYAIEEPETSQHPNHQLMLIGALVKLSEARNTQVLFSTHSANLVKEIPISSLCHIYKDDDRLVIAYGQNEDGTENEGVINLITKTLGILPNPHDKVKVLLYLEGYHDVGALQKYSHIINAADNTVINLLISDEVGYVITGGSTLKYYVQNKYLSGLGKPEVHLYDNDVLEYRRAVAQINAENNPRRRAFNTAKLELENYLHHDAIIEAYADLNIPGLALAAVNDNDDVPMVVAELVYRQGGNDWDILNPEKKTELASNRKKILNTQAVDKMTVERIRNRGGYEEMVNWLTTIRRLANE